MKFYKEYFGFEITNNNEPKILCVCGHKFIVSRQYYIVNKPLFKCPHCNEYWHIVEGFVGKGIASLIRPRTNSQIHIKHDRKIRL